MNGKINAFRQKRLFYLFDKHSLAAHLREGGVEETVAPGFNNNRFYDQAGMMGAYLTGDPGGLS
jgi:hypothetical protein